MSQKISDTEFETIRDFIYSVCGIYFHASKKYFLESRVLRRMGKTSSSSATEYLRLLKSSPAGKEEMKFLFDEVTTNETCFFRNVPQLTALEQQLLPQIVENKLKLGF